MADKQIEIAADGGKSYLSGTYSMPGTLTRYAGAQTLVLMVHGFPGHREMHNNLFGDCEALFNQYGLHTLRFDFRGCGRSEGNADSLTLDSAMADLNLVLDWAGHQAFENIILIGEGTGAYLCLNAVRPMVKMLMLFWPVADLALYAKGPAGKLLPDGLKTQMEAKGDPTFTPLNIPVLIQYGVQDKAILPDHADIIKDRVKARRIDITSYQDGGAGLPDLRHRQMIFFHIGQFLEKYA